MSFTVRVASRSRAFIDGIAELLKGTDFAVQDRYMVNGDRDPLHGAEETPEVLIYHVSQIYTEELSAFSARAKDAGCPLIVVGDGTDPQVMRVAMQAGSRDFLVEPVQREELLEALDRMELDRAAESPREHRTIAFVNAKGGCGASFLAANLAHMMCEVGGTSTVLVDLDVQFATIPQYLDLQPSLGLLETLAAADELDQVALEAYLVKHASGLKVLSSVNRAAEPCDDVSRRFDRLAHLLAQGHRRTVIDVPRHLDALGAAALMKSDRILLVVQQNLPAIRDAVSLLRVMREELAIGGDRFTVCVNRYRRDATIELSDIRRTLKIDDVLEVPNHFKTVAESIDAGVPILDYARQSPVAKALVPIAVDWSGSQATAEQSFIARKLASFLRT